VIKNIIQPQLAVFENASNIDNIIGEMLQQLPTSLVEQIVHYFDERQEINDALFRALVTRRLLRLVLTEDQPKLTYLGIYSAAINAVNLQNITIQRYARDTTMAALIPNCKVRTLLLYNIQQNLKILNVAESRDKISDTTYVTNEDLY
jgi:hypothetical protein